MGCAYSNHNERSKNKSNDVQMINRNEIVNDPIRNNQRDGHSNSNRQRIFVATYLSMNGQKQPGQNEINDHEFVFHYDDNDDDKRLDWPLKYLIRYSGYGCNNGWFSFECGRKNLTRQGHHIFECSSADQLFDTLVQQIGVMFNSINQNHNGINQKHSQSHSQMSNDLVTISNNGPLSLHEYQNLSSFTNDPFRPGSNLDHVIPVNSQMPTTRSSSSTGVHTYLNSTVTNGQMKSQPNYCSTNPMSHNSSGASSHLIGSKHSLNEIGSNAVSNNYRWPSSCLGNHSYDSRTFSSMMPNENSTSHVNASGFGVSNNCNSGKNRNRRSSDSNQDHLYLNHNSHQYNNNIIYAKKMGQIQSKMDESDNLGTFCYVNFDQNMIKNRKSAINEFKSRFSNNNSRVVTPESYVELLFNSKIDGDIQTKNQQQQSKSLVDTDGDDLKMVMEIKGGNGDSPISRKYSSTSMVAINANNKNDSPNGCVGDSNRIRRNSKNNFKASNNNLAQTTVASTTTSVSYAKIDFAKTLALQASTANHRKL